MRFGCDRIGKFSDKLLIDPFACIPKGHLDGRIFGEKLKRFQGVSCLHLALLEHTGIKSRKFTPPKKFQEIFAFHFDAEFIAGIAGLADLDDSGADAKRVVEVDFGFQQPFHREVFAELSGSEILAGECFLPVGIVFGGVEINGFVHSTVDTEVRLPIPVQPQCVEVDASRDRGLKDAGEDRFTLIVKGSGEREIKREEMYHDD